MKNKNFKIKKIKEIWYCTAKRLKFSELSTPNETLCTINKCFMRYLQEYYLIFEKPDENKSPTRHS